MIKPEFIEIIPHYPLPIPINKREDYSKWPLLMMKRKGFSVRVVALMKRGQKEKEIIDGIEVIRFSNFLNLFFYVARKRKALFYAQGRIFPLFTGFFSKKSIYVTHGTMGKKLPKYLSNPFARFLYRVSLSKFKKVITISSYETTLLKKFRFKNNLVYIPNAINTEFFSKANSEDELDEFCKKYSLSRKSKKIVFLGNMHKGDKTNIETLFRAFKKVLLKFPDCKLIIIGKFPKKIKKMEEFFPIANSVIFTGWLPHTEFIKAFGLANVFVNTSRYEGNPLSIGEAVSAKIPVCISNIPTLRSFYKDSVLYHNPWDYKKLAENIVSLLVKGKEKEARIEKAYNIIQSSTIIKVKQAMEKAIKEVLGDDPLKAEWKLHWQKNSIEHSIKQIDFEHFFTTSFNKLFAPGDKVLEAGCGFGRYCFWLENRGIDAQGVDIIKEAIETGKKFAKKNKYKSKLMVGDVCKLPFRNNSFNGYVSLGVVEHFRTKKELENAFREAYRVLKPGGKAFFVVPNPISPHMLLERMASVMGFAKLYHKDIHGKDLVRYGERAGLKVLDREIHDFYFPFYSIINILVRRDIWLLKSIMKRFLNIFDRVPILNNLGSGVAITFEK